MYARAHTHTHTSSTQYAQRQRICTSTQGAKVGGIPTEARLGSCFTGHTVRMKLTCLEVLYVRMNKPSKQFPRHSTTGLTAWSEYFVNPWRHLNDLSYVP